MLHIFHRLMRDGRGVTGIEYTLIAILLVTAAISAMTIVSARHAHALGIAL